ncbi:hypothetical protein A3H65_02565 [Candidatus Giovannonibacteria bacterium RIFCSPLOWO2_02_FULL_45_14]|uniref:Uncharacterized protein n=3 Tax=Parcubacteria group TaxID=1794811 RepID=A0A0H4TXE6_9BACT|nr:hypothetical protein [uncultured Parcubacteria bacterium Rifle_16ft_4_minimus_37658]AKQ05704.1 hypothetical protein [uncultured Parcubacteria bacterium Rifle_16ft_4_minimus_23641]OGF69526.1 MAG: hypothetical protein A3C75_00230 [Candidatus Giovannonibacteria bacterium RIFCSPHIGHO2_02_FULL_44_31]OGF76941.1 MAG: hypothetical protein A3E62_01220 [Candidatus Giovannonibacteria bacterium RIFCSPHIGHO2_12_FULL_44_29]OGF90442.1 MAG: hypothetical protein A3H65_02565 [Candidatus Giovannonibacteria bac
MTISLQEKKIEKAVERGVLKALHKASLDRQLSQALEDIREGRMSQVFSSAKDFVQALHKDVKQLRSKRKY